MKRIYTIAALITLGVCGRLVPHLPNATPMSAITLAASRYVGRFWAITTPLIALAVSDAVIGFYDLRILASVYLSFAGIGLVGWFMRNRLSAEFVLYAAIAASLAFFVITNTAVWAFSPWYEKSLSGLLFAYELGLPFLRNMVVGDLLYTALIFGVVPRLARARRADFESGAAERTVFMLPALKQLHLFVLRDLDSNQDTLLQRQ